MFKGDMELLEEGIDIAAYKVEFKQGIKILESAVGSRYAMWQNGQRFIYCPTCGKYEPEEKFNDSEDFVTGKKLWCKKHEVKITTVKGFLHQSKTVTQEMCMNMPEMNPSACEAARNKVQEIKEKFKWKLEDLFTPFDVDFRGLFVDYGGELYNF